MPSLNQLIAQGAVCHCLRAKTMFYEPVVSNAMLEIHDEHDVSSQPSGPFWCVLTQTIHGPDGGLVEVDSCRPGRSCCQTA